MQAIWIAASIQRHLQILFMHDTPMDPLQELNQLKALVLQQGRGLYPAIPRAVVSAVTVETMHDLELYAPLQPVRTIRCSKQAKVLELVQAECCLHSCEGFRVFTMDSHGLKGHELLSTYSKLMVTTDTVEGHDKTQPNEKVQPHVPFAPVICQLLNLLMVSLRHNLMMWTC